MPCKGGDPAGFSADEKKAQSAKTAPDGGWRRSSAFTTAAFLFPSKGRGILADSMRPANSGHYVFGVSNSADADLRLPQLLRTPAVLRQKAAGTRVPFPAARIDIARYPGTLLCILR